MKNNKNQNKKSKPQEESNEEPEMKKLEIKAYDSSKKAHEGQLRDEGTPYFEHVERVAKQVLENCDSQAYITALLHDVLEDTDYTYDNLKKEYSEEIAKDVLLLTKKEGESFEDYMKKLVVKYAPFYIKLVDRLDNIKSLPACGSDEKISKYLKETENEFLPIAKSSRYSKLDEFDVLIKEIEAGCKALK
ncbi:MULTISPECIES: HD domain-containing protein [unclassified Fusibacter]|uniref:HD domain-containing protein n=1 Tax=unclassified Fusibacter TaxID=2624464 RepID=UPI0010130FA0|nr:MULTISPECIES: HD domain-containing protein [unclassified Fusibacter]MCK8059189.1 HD domain-containing protein [Fusibacter sp. A2]NPE22600.1 HD domain-containing protein [Fusibacter sp. A1]RXV60700.1 HD domain-containing protein [Fusibacter sp. A1]